MNRTGWEIPWQRGIDIDTFEDWAMAEVLLRLPQFRPEDVGAGVAQDVAQPVTGSRTA